MAGEPWCFSPAEVAPLTDYQIDEVYLKPAVKRAEAMERERKGLPPAAEPKPLAEPPPREAMIRFAMSALGKTRAQAEADYDAQLAEWGKQKGEA
jgi:hypothetical protein